MAGSGTIRVEAAVLEKMADDVRHVTRDMLVATVVDFSASGPVDGAYDRMCKRWDGHRDEIESALQNVASILDAIRETFVGLDHAHADALRGGGSRVER